MDEPETYRQRLEREWREREARAETKYKLVDIKQDGAITTYSYEEVKPKQRKRMNLIPNFVRKALGMQRIYSDSDLPRAMAKSCHYVAGRYKAALEQTQQYSEDQVKFFYQRLYEELLSDSIGSQSVFVGMVPQTDRPHIPTENLRDALIAAGIDVRAIDYPLQFMLYPGTVYDTMTKKLHYFDV